MFSLDWNPCSPCTGISVQLRRNTHRSKLVSDQRYFDQLMIYIHLNPVHAGIVDDPAQYPWSGHRELLGQTKQSIVDVDEVLRVFGSTRRSARAAYVRRLKGSLEKEWIGEEPGSLPWWRLGRPSKEEDGDLEKAIRERRAREVLGPNWRPTIETSEFVARVTEGLGVSIDDLQSRRRSPELVRARELLMILGVERYGLKVKELAKELRKSPDGMTQTISRAARRRRKDKAFLADLNTLDHSLAEG